MALRQANYPSLVQQGAEKVHQLVPPRREEPKATKNLVSD